jgi:hypothetical protein
LPIPGPASFTPPRPTPPSPEPPSPEMGRRAASPSVGGKSAEWRIERILQRMGNSSRNRRKIPASLACRQGFGRKASLVIL